MKWKLSKILPSYFSSSLILMQNYFPYISTSYFPLLLFLHALSGTSNCSVATAKKLPRPSHKHWMIATNIRQDLQRVIGTLWSTRTFGGALFSRFQQPHFSCGNFASGALFSFPTTLVFEGSSSVVVVSAAVGLVDTVMEEEVT